MLYSFKFIRIGCAVLVASLLWSNHAQPASPDKKLITLVSVKYNDDRRDYYKHVANKSFWKENGTQNLQKIIKQKFGTDKFSSVIVRPNKCYVFYAKTTHSGSIEHFSSTGLTSSAKAQQHAKSRKASGYNVIDTGCNDGIPLKHPNSPFPLISEGVDFEKDVDNLLKTRNGQYSCSELGTKSFKMRQPIDGIYALESSTAKVTVNARHLSKNDDDNKKAINDFINDMEKGFETVCGTGSAAKMLFTGSLIKLLKKHYRTTYKDCLRANKHNKQACKHHLRNYAHFGLRG